jgi:hypothetical protein
MMSTKNALSFYESGMEKGTYGNIEITHKLVKLSWPIFKCSSGQWAFENHSACGCGQLHFHKARGLFTPSNALSM